MSNETEFPKHVCVFRTLPISGIRKCLECGQIQNPPQQIPADTDSRSGISSMLHAQDYEAQRKQFPIFQGN